MQLNVKNVSPKNVTWTKVHFRGNVDVYLNPMLLSDGNEAHAVGLRTNFYVL